MNKINPHALADWAIATGRLPLDGRAAFLDAFAADPLVEVGRVLARAPTRDVDRPCPLGAPATPRRKEAGLKSHRTRRARQSAAADLALSAVQAALGATGVDTSDPEVREKVGDALQKLSDRDKAKRRRARRTKAQRDRRERARDEAGMWLPRNGRSVAEREEAIFGADDDLVAAKRHAAEATSHRDEIWTDFAAGLPKPSTLDGT